MNKLNSFESQRRTLSELCQQLSEFDRNQDRIELARRRNQLCAEHGVYRWFVPETHGGFGWSPLEIMQGYLEISSVCLSTAFVLTQRTGAVSRLVGSDNEQLRDQWLPQLASGEIFATVGISHLTTSRQHVGRPVLMADPEPGGFRLNGFSPWVTGVSLADIVIVGAVCPDENQVLIAVPTELVGVTRPPTADLMALTDSCTGEFRMDNVFVEERYLVGGPVENIMAQGKGANTGGLQTSTLALGLARAAIEYLQNQSEIRDGFSEQTQALESQFTEARKEIFAMARGSSECTNATMRAQVNSLALRATQAALTVAKGAGYLENHPVGRWCREALFFLIWSCPQPVAQSNLCELARIEC